MKKTLAYCRVSSDDQVKCGSVRTQQAEIQRYAERVGVYVHEVHTDDGVSGKIPIAERPAGARLIEAVDRGEVDAVVLYSIDRLGREDWDILMTAAYLRQRGVRLISTSQPIDDSTSAGRLQLGFYAICASKEWEDIRQRTRDGRHRVFREGGWIGGPTPFGYAIARDSDKDLAHLVPHPQCSVIVVRLYERYAAGDTLQDLANWLVAMGIPTAWNRTHWQPAVVRKILANPLYKGEYIHHGERSTVPALVSPELWERAQERFRRNREQRSLNRENPYLLTGYLLCYHCGSSYCGAVIPNGRGTEYRYYRCNQRKHLRPRCIGRMVPCDALESRVIDALRQILDDGLAAFFHVQQQRLREIEAEPDRGPAIQAQIDALADQRQIVIGLCTDGIITREDLAQQLERIAERRKALDEEPVLARSARLRAEQVEHDLQRLWANLERAEQFLRGERQFSGADLRGLFDALKLQVQVETVPHGERSARLPLHIGTYAGHMTFDSAK